MSLKVSMLIKQKKNADLPAFKQGGNIEGGGKVYRHFKKIM